MRKMIIATWAVIAVMTVGMIAFAHDDHGRSKATDESVQALVFKAVQAYEEGGTEALNAMSDPNSTEWYDDGDLYVFAWDIYRRMVVVHGGNPDRVGRLIDDPLDPLPFRARAVSILYQAQEQPEGVWVHYAHVNPLADDRKQRITLKRAYIVTSGDIVFGVGRYMKRRRD